jgi:shikimate kinase
MTILEIFKKKGEDFFRTMEEKETLKSLKKNNSIRTIIRIHKAYGFEI